MAVLLFNPRKVLGPMIPKPMPLGSKLINGIVHGQAVPIFAACAFIFFRFGFIFSCTTDIMAAYGFIFARFTRIFQQCAFIF